MANGTTTPSRPHFSSPHYVAQTLRTGFPSDTNGFANISNYPVIKMKVGLHRSAGNEGQQSWGYNPLKVCRVPHSYNPGGLKAWGQPRTDYISRPFLRHRSFFLSLPMHPTRSAYKFPAYKLPIFLMTWTTKKIPTKLKKQNNKTTKTICVTRG